MDVTHNAGVKAARQPTNGHPNLAGTVAIGRLRSMTAFQLSLKTLVAEMPSYRETEI